MRLVKVPRAGAWVFVSLLGVGAMAASYPGGAAELVSDLRDYGTNAERVKQGDLAKRDILDRFAMQNDREELKAQLRGQLARGEVSLSVAADRYAQSLAADPHLLPLFRRAIPGSTDEERVAASLIREVLDLQMVSWNGQKSLLDQFHSEYGSEYPFPVPTLSAGLPSDTAVGSEP